jgi:o-succinylbenzoate---CoA ligase
MGYTHPSITLNQHEVSVRAILENSYTSNTEFEAATTQFIRSWLIGQTTFTLHTSGSTGMPKAITFLREQMIASANATIQALQLKENNVVLVCLPTQYVAGIMMLVRALIGNLRIVAVEPSANPLQNFRSKVSINFAALVPYQAEALLAAQELNGIDSLEKVIIGGAPVSRSLQQRLANTASIVYQTYGMTETLSHVALQKITAKEDFFTALPGVHMAVDNRGCLVIKTNYLPEPVVTNDMVELLGVDSFRWLGRVDNVINSGGIKLHPESIEQKIATAFQDVKIENNFFVFGQPDPVFGNVLVLVVEGKLPLENAIVLQKLSQNLTRYEVPKRILYAPVFLKTETGKVKRAETVAACLQQ